MQPKKQLKVQYIHWHFWRNRLFLLTKNALLKRGPKNSGMGRLPLPSFGQCPKENVFLLLMSSLTWSSPNSPSHIVLMLVVVQQIWSQFWISELKRCESRAGRRISKFCRRKECQFRLEARRIIQLFRVGLPRFSCQIIIFCQIMIGNKSYLRRRLRPTEKKIPHQHICC